MGYWLSIKLCLLCIESEGHCADDQTPKVLEPQALFRILQWSRVTGVNNMKSISCHHESTYRTSLIHALPLSFVSFCCLQAFGLRILFQQRQWRPPRASWTSTLVTPLGALLHPQVPKQIMKMGPNQLVQLLPYTSVHGARKAWLQWWPQVMW